MKALLIYNDFAAKNHSEKVKSEILRYFSEFEIECDLLSPRTVEEAKENLLGVDLNEYSAVAIAGGDGTIHHTINSLARRPGFFDCTLAVIPTGTGNAFARDLGLSSKNLKSAVSAIRNGKTKKADIAEFISEAGKFYFLNILGIGFVTDVARTAHKMKILGGISYLLGVLFHTLFLKSFNIKIISDGKTFNRDVVFAEISNSRYTGADFLMAPEAKIDDGYLDITIMNKCSRRILLSGLPKIFKGKHIEMKEVETIRGAHIKIETEIPKILTPDGEIFGSTPVEIICLHKKISVITAG